ncbi:protein of unknown function [Streptomyces sp. KY70]|nr:protein of unknown function [Streptomyces sp. KY70]
MAHGGRGGGAPGRRSGPGTAAVQRFSGTQLTCRTKQGVERDSVQPVGVDTGLCPLRDSSPGGVGAGLGYAPWDASGSGTGRSGGGLCGGSGPGRGLLPEMCRACPKSVSRGLCALLFDSPQRASHSMHHAYSFALEYARSACCGDCTSTMLSRKGITFRDPEEARGDVSAGSDGVSGAGASGSAGGRSGSRRGGAGP